MRTLSTPVVAHPSRALVSSQVNRGRIGVLSLPLTGKPFVEARPRRSAWGVCRSLPLTGKPFVEANTVSQSDAKVAVSLPLTGKPFVEARTLAGWLVARRGRFP